MDTIDSTPWSPAYPFERESILQHAPREAGLYKLIDRDGVMAYLGMSKGTDHSTIQKRLLDHWDAKGCGNKYVARLRAYAEAVGGNLGFTFAFFVCDAASARALEAVRTTTEKPVLNTRAEWAGLYEDIALSNGRSIRVKHSSGHFH